MIRNEDVGFVHEEQPVQVKLAAYPFQKYGMIQGRVAQVSPDSAEDQNRSSQREGRGASEGADSSAAGASRNYRALIDLDSQTLNRDNVELKLLAGMEVIAEINEGQRTIMEYLVSPVQKTIRESARER